LICARIRDDEQRRKRGAIVEITNEESGWSSPLVLTGKWRAGRSEKRKSGSVKRVEKRSVLWENQNWS